MLLGKKYSRALIDCHPSARDISHARLRDRFGRASIELRASRWGRRDHLFRRYTVISQK